MLCGRSYSHFAHREVSFPRSLVCSAARIWAQAVWLQMLALICVKLLSQGQSHLLENISSCRTSEWKVLAPQKDLGFDFFLGCVTPSKSFSLSALSSGSSTFETGKQKQQNGCDGGRRVTKMNGQYTGFPVASSKWAVYLGSQFVAILATTLSSHTIFYLVLTKLW